MAHRVLILDNEMEMGGKEKSLFQFISRADRTRFPIAVCCLKTGGYFKPRLKELGVPVYEGLQGHRFDAAAFSGLKRVLRAERSELIYTFSHPNTVIFSMLARSLGLVKRVVVSYHAMQTADGNRHVPRYLLPLLRRADALLAVAEIHRDYLVRVEGLPREKITVIHNGVDTERYRVGTPDERARARGSFGAREDEVVLATVASLKPLKNIEGLLRATAQLHAGGMRVRLILAGDGPSRRALEDLAASLGVADRIHFLGVRDDVEQLLRGADVFVLPSLTEAFPNVVLEAMATGLAVVSTEVGSVREMVESDRSAVLVPAADDAALAAAIRGLAADPARREAFGRRGREIVEARFRIDTMCRAREAVIESLLNPASAGSPS